MVHEENEELRPKLGARYTHLVVVVSELLVVVGSEDNKEKNRDDSLLVLPMEYLNHLYVPQDHDDSDKSTDGDHIGVHDEGECYSYDAGTGDAC
jgi:hypothetical protein